MMREVPWRFRFRKVDGIVCAIVELEFALMVALSVVRYLHVQGLDNFLELQFRSQSAIRRADARPAKNA